MEDGVTETEKLQVFTSIDEDHEKEAAREVMDDGEDVEEKPVGLINQLISNFTTGGKEEDAEEEKIAMNKEITNEEEETTNNGGREDVEEKPIGLINEIISRFAPEDKQEENQEKEEQVGGGGLLSHIMSNLVSSPVSSPRGRDEKQAEKAAGDVLFDNPEKDVKGDDGGGGIIDNIVSNLPTPLPDDAAPASDEASILIHSIIHD